MRGRDLKGGALKVESSPKFTESCPHSKRVDCFPFFKEGQDPQMSGFVKARALKMLSPALESKKEGAQTMCLGIISGSVCCTRRRSPIVVQFSKQKEARVCLIINRKYHSDRLGRLFLVFRDRAS